MTLTEQLLTKAAGWPVVKEAKAMHAAGRVTSARYEPPMLLGLVRGGAGEFKCGLKINSPSDVENLCSCPDSRRRGIICAHSVAAALEVISPAQKKPAAPAPAVPASTPAAPARIYSPDSSGASITLHIIFPPQFAAGWDKKSLTIVIECGDGTQRKPFGTVPPGQSRRCDEADAVFLEKLLSFTGGKPASMALLSNDQAAEILTSLAGHPRITFGRSQPVQIRKESLCPPLHCMRKPDGSLTLSVKLETRGTLLRSRKGNWLLDGATLQPVAACLPAAYSTLFDVPVTIPAAGAAGFLGKELSSLAQFFAITGDVAVPAAAALEESAARAPAEAVHIQLEGSLRYLAASFMTGRSRAAERRLESYGFDEPNSEGLMILRGENAVLAFCGAGLPKLQREWKVQLGERFGRASQELEVLEPALEVRGTGAGWFDLACEMRTSGGDRYTPAEITRLLETGQRHVKHPDGKFTVFDPDMLDDFSELLRDSNPEQKKPGVYRLQNRQAGGIQAFAAEAGLAVRGDRAWQDWTAAMSSPDKLQPADLGPLESVLRSYQKQGVAWLEFLARNGFAGILADEMGLGKTLQALAFLNTLKGTGPCLIVCPSSLIFNWRAEAEKWLPGANVLTVEGTRRSADLARAGSAQIVITSYPLLRLDVEQHRLTEYAAVILDEAQHIKNPDSQNAKAACALRARHRFALTGTPVENSVKDLWSLMHFLMPGYLGNRRDFKERYEAPISAGVRGPEQQRLSRRLSPFLLRRTKKAVASELPDKIEQVAWCELSPLQREIYTGIAEATRKQVTDLVGPGEEKKARMVMLTALLRLRQAACDVRLLGLEKEPPAEEASAKLEMLMELLEESMEGGHRVLVFSQFVSMLAHIRARLNDAGIDHCYLDGQTRDRAGQVEKFQAGGTPVFLISLKAGGTGLNLTAADTVIHFDPWWNPAVEAQATDRAHRIGQKSVVTSYKLIARGTVEEKILTLQAKKREVIAATLENEQPLMEGLSMIEIRDLLGA